MNVPDLIREFENEGIRLWEEDGSLRYRAPKGVLTEERRSGLRERKQAIIEYLRGRQEAREIQPQLAERYEPFPLTEIQAAYLLGRRESFAYGGVGCHGYGELVFSDLDVPRLTAAWQTIIRRHEMLRAVVHEDGTQQILSDIPDYEIAVLDLQTAPAEQAGARLEQVRAQMDHRVYEPQNWPLFDLAVTLMPNQAILHFSIDLLIADFVSTQLLLEELHELLQEPDCVLPAVDVSFRDYVLATQTHRESEQYIRDRDYWMRTLPSLPPAPELPLQESKSEQPPRFRRQQLTLTQEEWAALSARVVELGITPSTAVLAVFSETIARWCRRPSFTLNITLQNRLPLHPAVNRLVGDFTALEMLAVDASPAASFRERARALQLRLWEDLDHRSFTGSEVMRELSRLGAHSGLFPVVFTSSIGVAIGREGAPKGLGDLTHGITQTPQVWIDCQAMESRHELIVNWDTRQDVFPSGLVEDMFSAFEDLLKRAASSSDVWDETDPVKLPAAQVVRQRLANETQAPLPPMLLHEGVVAQALRSVDRLAVITLGGVLTFGELLGKALSVAKALGENGAVPGDLVAVVLEKGRDQPVAVLGILLAGCAYLPLDTDQPPTRRNQVLADAAVRLVLVHSAKAGETDWLPGIHLMGIGDITPSELPEGLPARLAEPTDPAYVMYTSGSTGSPKGVAISHVSAVNTIADINSRFNIGPSDRVLGLSNLGFDLSVYDIFGVLAAGGCLVLPDDCRRADPSHWAQLIVENEVSIWNSVPALMQMLHDYLSGESDLQTPLTSLRLAMLSGDWIPLRLPDQIRKLLPNLSLVSLGGATEAAIWSIWHPIGTVLPEWRSIPYGKPLTNQCFHVLDQALRPCPDWVAGELYIGGAGLALGYWRNEAQTANRFIHNPATGERLYRTGDWGRYSSDGSIEFLGREDRQVKIRGFRIELAEVEAAVSLSPAVGRAAVLVEGDKTSDRRLVAFVEPVMHAHDARTIPDYSELASVAQQAAAELSLGPGYAEHLARLDEAALLSMLSALKEWGLFGPNPDSLEHILSQLSLHHRRLVRRWIQVLRQSGLLASNPETRFAATREVDRTLVAEAWRRTEEGANGFENGPLIGFFGRFAQRLPELLSSEGNASKIIPSEDQYQFLQAIYGDALLSRWAKRLMNAVLTQIGAGQKSRLRVLEIGAVSPLSVGDTTASAGGIEALVTDPSAYVLEETRKRLGDHESVRFMVFDVNRPYRLQGLQPNSFDVIIASNSLHRATNIDTTMRQLTELLSPSGWMIFSEATKDHYPIMTSLELLLNPDPVTGDYLDQRQGQDQNFLSAGQWTEVITRAGGELVRCVSECAEHSPIRVFAARFKTDREPLDTRELELFVAERLPAYMVPSQFQVLDSLPLTANAKIDYKLLRAWIPQRGSSVALTANEDRSDLECRLSELWSEVLNAGDIRPDQGFLSLGGDSLIAARLAGRLREKIPEAKNLFFDELLQQILRGATIAELASTLTGAEQRLADRAPLQTVALRNLGGDGEQIRVVVPDNLSDLAALDDLTQLLSAHGRVFGLEVENTEAFLSCPADSLIMRVASTCVEALIDDASLSIDVIGSGTGSALALEVARQMTEAGGIVGNLVVIGGPLSRGASAAKATSDTPVYSHSLQALESWSAAAYAGAVTVLLRHEDSDLQGEATSFWSSVCLGELNVTLVREGADGIVAALLGQDSKDRAALPIS